MRILLVHAALPRLGKHHQRARHKLFPSLTLPYLAGLFPETYDIVLCDDDVEDIPFEQDFDLVGIAFYGHAANRAFEIAHLFRKRDIRVVFGGSTATMMPEICGLNCDTLVLGDAENVMPQLVRDLEAGKLARIYRSSDQADLTNLPTPRYDLLNAKNYTGAYAVQTARGCIFNCTFCTIPELNGHRVRYRPISSVIRDIHNAIIHSKKRRIFFVDDNINMNPSRAMELFEAITPLKIEWCSYATSIIGRQPELLQRAAASGCRLLFIGFESLSKNRLVDVEKPCNSPDNYEDIISSIHDHGIHIMPSFIFGLDGDTPDIFKRTFDFVEANRLSLPTYHILAPMPGSRLFVQFQTEGRQIDIDLKQFDPGRAVFEPRGMSRNDLEVGYKWIVRSTYHPLSILRRTIIRKPIGGWRRLRVQLMVAAANCRAMQAMRRKSTSSSPSTLIERALIM